MIKRLICFEGISGSGKSTQVDLAYSFLLPNVIKIPELNQFSPLKESIEKWKSKIKKFDLGVVFDIEDIKSLAKARAETYYNIISNYLNRDMALTDRSVYTSIVYESGIVSPKDVENENRLAGVVFPDFGFVLDCDPLVAQERIDSRRINNRLYDSRSIHENLEELTKRREIYLSLSKEHPELIVISTASKNSTPKQVFEKIKPYLK